MSDPTTTPTPTNEQQDARGEHPVTVEWDGGMVSYRMVCNATANALCHAVYRCDCETYYRQDLMGGRPAHLTAAGHVHFGRFDPTYCNLREWFDVEPVEALHGSLTFPVTAQWNGDGYEFEVGQPTHLAAVSAAAPDEREALARAFAEHHARKVVYAIDYEHADVALTALAARPAPVVSGEAVEQAVADVAAMRDYLLMDEGYEDAEAAVKRLGEFARSLIPVADAPAADDEGGQE